MRSTRRSDAAIALVALAGLLYANTLFAQLPELFDVHANGEIYALAVQPDGKILVGGQIYRVDEQPRVALTRLWPDGTLDLDFHVGVLRANGGNTFVDAVLLQTDGKIVIHGNYVTLDGQPITELARLNADGTLDRSFSPAAGTPGFTVGPALGMQLDGKILAYGWVTNSSGDHVANYLVRLNSDGSLDQGFQNPRIGESSYALPACVAFDADGKLLVGGQFTSIGRMAFMNLARLNADGSPDLSFVAPAIDPLARVTTLLVQPDGKVLIGGWFQTIGGVDRQYMARLFADGRLDTSFNRGGGNGIGLGVPNSMVLQTDGKLIAVGYFADEYVPGQPYGIRRLNSDGSVDDSFDSSIVGEWLYSLALQADGRVLVGGYFTMSPQSYKADVGRLNQTDPATHNLSFVDSTIRWMRAGAGPEVWATTFEYSTNGLDWMALGTGTRIADGWQCAAANCPTGATIRARGFTTGGKNNGSSWYVESMIGRPGITMHPSSRTNNAGTTAIFSVVAGGDSPLTYRWQKDGLDLAEGPLIFGVTSPTLMLSNVIAATSGNYSVTINNARAKVTSRPAQLVVLDPAINGQPTNQLLTAGRPATINVNASGTSPLTFHWFKDGTLLPGATNAAIDFDSVQWNDRGTYQATVSSAFGTVTSAVATITVNMAPVDPFHTTNIVGDVKAVVVQPDGKLVVASEWSEVSEMPIDYLVRLNADGTRDESFNPGAPPAYVHCLALQPDGKIIVAGAFTNLGGGACTNLARLNPDGTLDPAFSPSPTTPPSFLWLQADGKLLVGGWGLTNLAGAPCPEMGRLNPDGSLDAGFHPQLDGVQNYLLAEQADGKILIQSVQTNDSQHSYARIERLNADGTPDPTFTRPQIIIRNWYTSSTHLAVLGDGKLLVAGEFDFLAATACTNLGRLNSDGTFDSTFTTPQAEWSPGYRADFTGFAEQTDGQILVGGYFRYLNRIERQYIARVEPDGSLDLTYNPSTDAGVTVFAFLPNGKVVAGGTTLAIFDPTSPAVETLSSDGTSVAWLRTGSAGEIWNASFDYSIDGVQWSALGAGVRIPGGWHLSNLNLPLNAQIRAHGYVANGSSSGFIEQTTIVHPQTRPLIPINPANLAIHSNQFGFDLNLVDEALIIEASTNLQTWLPLSTNAPTAGQTRFIDPTPATAPTRFYRLRLWP